MVQRELAPVSKWRSIHEAIKLENVVHVYSESWVGCKKQNTLDDDI